MNKMTKGAIATGIGVALLLGGGGTLALWSDSEKSNADPIAAGNLDLELPAPGTWSSNMTGNIKSISTYHVVPGEQLTYRQFLTPILVGDRVEATLTATGPGTGTFAEGTLTVSSIFKDGDEVVGTLKNPLDSSDSNKSIEASTTFVFETATSGRQSVLAKHRFEDVSYKLEQLPPQAVAAS
jgi:alternate signal-mediated exported protein